MRMMLRFTLPVEKGNQAFKDGSLGKTLESIMNKLKPEAAYFGPSDGMRSGMMFFDLAEAMLEAGDAGDGVVKLDRIALALAHHDRRNLQMTLRQHVERGEGVADGAEIAADHQQQRYLQRRHPVEHRALAIERHHDAADALDEQDAGLSIDCLAAERDQLREVDAAAFAQLIA